MILNEQSFTYEDMMNLLSDKEIKLLLEFLKFMNEDNFVYLYQKSQRKKPIIDIITDRLDISRKTVQNMLSSILDKQDDERYFLYKVPSKIKGEYFISPELAVKEKRHYDVIYRTILPRLRKGK